MRTLISLAAVAALCSLVTPAVAQITPSKESLSKLYPGEAYSPYAERRFPSRPLWGDTHLHTGLSVDEYRKYQRGSQSIPVPVSGKQCVGACRYAGLRGANLGYFALFSAH